MKNRARRYAFGAVIAAAAGYLAGVLTAPKSGKETRQDVKDAAIKAKQEAEKQLKAMHSELDQLLNQAKNGAKKLKKGAAEEFASVITKAQFAKQKAREILSVIHEGDATDKDLQEAVKEVKQATDHLKSFIKKHPEASS
ncbi:MAG: YtxH domain-containing protein [Candidatus Saccharimonadales bacterium]